MVEGPWVMFREGTYFLFYSTGNYKLPTYRLMVAKSRGVMGPFTKGEVAVVETDLDNWNVGMNTTFEGPGHGSVVVDNVGDWWLVYHSWKYHHQELEEDPGRVMLLDKLEWHGAPLLDLWPRVAGSVPSHTEQGDPVV